MLLQAVRETSQNFLPFGMYHFIHGTQIRTPDTQETSTAGSAASHAEYAERVCHHLDAKHLPKIAWLTGFKTGGLMDHKVSHMFVRSFIHSLIHSFIVFQIFEGPTRTNGLVIFEVFRGQLGPTDL